MVLREAHLPIDFSAMSNGINVDESLPIINLEEDSIISDPDSVSRMTLEFLYTGRARTVF